MISSSEQLELLRVIEAAEAAVMDIYDTTSAETLDVTLKADNSPLTQADLAAHRILSAGLARLFPDIPVISEEGDEAKNQQIVLGPTFWLVDPLDGTKEFIARNGEFTVCVALIENDVPVYGVVAAPALRVTYYGGPGMGSYKKQAGQDAEPLRVPEQPVGAVLGSHSHAEAGTAAYIAEHFADFAIKAVGSQLKLPYIAEGLADAYPRLEHTMKLWDLAAGQAILEGAGGSVTRPDSSAIDYHTPTLLAGDFVALARAQ